MYYVAMGVTMNRLTSSVFLGIGLAAIVLITGAKAWAHDGQVDVAFGDRGHIVVGRPFYFMSVGPDGGVALLGRFEVARVLSNGEPDPRFGAGGSQVLPETIEGSPYVLSALAVDDQERIILFGSAFPPGYPVVGREPGSVQVTRGLVMRLSPEGELDPSFDEGSGAVVSAFGLSSKVPELSGQPTTSVLAGIVDSQDRPVLVAGVAGSYSPCISHSFYAPFAREIVRLTSSGSLDRSFGGGDGRSPALRNLNAQPPPRLGLTTTDQPLVMGAEGSACARSSLAFRFNANGEPFLGYGSQGRFHLPFRSFGSIAASTGSGGLVLRQGVPVATKVLRVTPAGSIDRAFGKDGAAVVHLPSGTNRLLTPVAVDSRNRVLLVGSYSRRVAGSDRKRASLVVERLLGSGRPDPGFGSGGMISTPIRAAQVLGHKEAVLDPQGRLLVLSQVRRPTFGTHAKVVLTRFKMGS